ncbi:MAG: PQQ-binding-like beta-propeller repeat protein [Ktedonobacterales bacterium]
MSHQHEASGEYGEHNAPVAHATLLTGSAHGTVIALDAATGAVLWHWAPGPRLGTLAHDGETVYFATTSPVVGRRRLDGPPPRTFEQYPNRKIVAVGSQVTLTALRARDGTEVWQREGWRFGRQADVALADDLLIADGPNEDIGQAYITAFDTRTGETRWRYDTCDPSGSSERLIAARAGRVFVREGGFGVDHLHVLDARTGAEVWDREKVTLSMHLSSGGKLVMVYEPSATGNFRHELLNAEDGMLLATSPQLGMVEALSDDGIAYVSRERYPHGSISAVRIGDSEELWRTDGIEAGHLLLAGDTLYYSWLTQHERLAEVGALDARTGQRLWQWRSPAHLLPLLWLWGRNTPLVITHALHEGRRSIARARQQHDRHIFVREVLRAQWRRPGALLHNFQMTAGWGMVYVATSLGLFALRSRDGRLLWHALPTYDLGWTMPVVSPERQDI